MPAASKNPSAQRLKDLDRASPQFFEELTTIFSDEIIRDLELNLSADDAQWLTNYLDDILTYASNPPRFTRCLYVLIRICVARRILPQSYTLPGTLSINSRPVISGTLADILEGTVDNVDVCIKRTRTYSVHSSGDVWLDISYQEAIIWKHMRHPNIVPFLGVTNAPFQLISKFMPGGNLMEYIKKHPSTDRVGLILGIADAIHHLHSHNVVHGNLKGPSVFVDDSGNACLMDFDLATVTPNMENVPIRQCCSLRWSAPEVLRGKAGIGKEADIYSLGMVIIEVLSGATPFHDSTPTSVVVKVLSGERPERPKDQIITQELWTLTQRCLEENPRRRPEIGEVIFRLRRVMATGKDRLCGSKVYTGNAAVESAHPRWRSLITTSRFSPTYPKEILSSKVSSQPLWPCELEKVNPQAMYNTHWDSNIVSKESWHSLENVEFRFSANEQRAHNIFPGPSNLLRRARVWFLNFGKASPGWLIGQRGDVSHRESHPFTAAKPSAQVVRLWSRSPPE